jgi:tetratricopeptide (TPR) repeat protein
MRAAAVAIAAAAVSLWCAVSAADPDHGARHDRGLMDTELTAADHEQRRHEFQAAMRRLDRVIAAEPHHAGALLMRASIAILLGDFAAARRDCSGVLRAGEALPGTICLASAMTGPGSLARARRVLATLGAAGASSPKVESWRLLTESDLALRDGDPAAALAMLERAHALQPADDEVRTRYADLLLDRGQAARALAIARGPGASLARGVVKARAALALQSTDAARYRSEIEGRLQHEHSYHHHAVPHDREEALVALHLSADAPRAFRHARRNFELQKDTVDLRLLVETAQAAGEVAELRRVRAWLDSTGFEDRVVDTRLRAAGV